MIELRNIRKSYDNKTDVVKDLNLVIDDGEIVVLIGESGCGKTTTLEMINRLIDPSDGEILIDGTDIMTMKKSELRRGIGYVIQNSGLLPHKTVGENIAMVPRLCKKDEQEIQKKVKELMELIDMPYKEFATRYPIELSGGQRQRVGVARALANDPDIILMDEPFSALDPLTREQLQDELLRLQDELNKSIVFVTHDMDEAIKVGNKIAIMQDGEIAQYGTPEKILKNPVNDFVAEFIGQNRLWSSPEYLRAQDVVEKKSVLVSEKRTAMQTVEALKRNKTQVAAVVENNRNGKIKFLGLVGLNRLLSLSDDSVQVGSIMKTDVKTVAAKMPLPQVLSLREELEVAYNPVIDEYDNFVGIISNQSIVNVLVSVMPGQEEY